MTFLVTKGLLLDTLATISGTDGPNNQRHFLKRNKVYPEAKLRKANKNEKKRNKKKRKGTGNEKK